MNRPFVGRPFTESVGPGWHADSAFSARCDALFIIESNIWGPHGGSVTHDWWHYFISSVANFFDNVDPASKLPATTLITNQRALGEALGIIIRNQTEAGDLAFLTRNARRAAIQELAPRRAFHGAYLSKAAVARTLLECKPASGAFAIEWAAWSRIAKRMAALSGDSSADEIAFLRACGHSE